MECNKVLAVLHVVGVRECSGLALVGRMALQAGAVDCVRLPARADGQLGRIERLDMGQPRPVA